MRTSEPTSACQPLDSSNEDAEPTEEVEVEKEPAASCEVCGWSHVVSMTCSYSVCQNQADGFAERAVVWQSTLRCAEDSGTRDDDDDEADPMDGPDDDPDNDPEDAPEDDAEVDAGVDGIVAEECAGAGNCALERATGTAPMVANSFASGLHLTAGPSYNA